MFLLALLTASFLYSVEGRQELKGRFSRVPLSLRTDSGTDLRCRYAGQYLVVHGDNCGFLVCEFGWGSLRHFQGSLQLASRRMACPPGTYVPAYLQDGVLHAASPCTGRNKGACHRNALKGDLAHDRKSNPTATQYKIHMNTNRPIPDEMGSIATMMFHDVSQLAEALWWILQVEMSWIAQYLSGGNNKLTRYPPYTLPRRTYMSYHHQPTGEYFPYNQAMGQYLSQNQIMGRHVSSSQPREDNLSKHNALGYYWSLQHLNKEHATKKYPIKQHMSGNHASGLFYPGSSTPDRLLSIVNDLKQISQRLHAIDVMPTWIGIYENEKKTDELKKASISMLGILARLAREKNSLAE